VDQEHLLDVPGQEERLLHRRVAAADDRDPLVLEEEAVAGGTSANPAPHQPLLALETDPPGLRPGSDDDGLREGRLLLSLRPTA
jgi:hypothetical protein